MMKTVRSILLQGALVLVAAPLAAQTVRNMSEPAEACRRAQELQRKKLYGLSQLEYERAMELAEAERVSPVFADAELHVLECAYEQRSPNAEKLMLVFLQEHPERAAQSTVRYLLGKLYYRDGRYAEALEMLGAFSPRALPGSEQQEYAFKKAYCLFMLREYDNAAPLFAQVKDGGGKYAAVATYYYAHIAYEQRRFSVALNGFESLRDDETFAKLVPYYVMHIHHSQRSYDKVIEEGRAFLEVVSDKRLPEMARLMGEAYYGKGMYAEALPYIEKYAETTPAFTRADKYLLGYVYYQNKRYDKAASLFEQITVGQDSLAQSAYYYLADAFIQQDDKRNAGRAFLQASKMDFFPEIKEDAMFSYAKLMFELNSGPFNDAIAALNLYLDTYPGSRRTDEVNKCLMQAYVHSRNYEAALAALQAIGKPDAEVHAALQKVAYFRAVELYQNQRYGEAGSMFDLSLKYAAYNPTTAALATYWKGEAAYREERYAEAQRLFNDFLLSAGGSHTGEYAVAHYSLAYSLFQQKQYAEAMSWFRKYAALAQGKPTAMLCDAHNRTGDCSFMQHAYADAIDSYAKVLALDLADEDYAAFQSGICYGLTGNLPRKIALMNAVIAFLPASPYAHVALYEKGRSYVQMQQYDQAVDVYAQLLSRFPQSACYAKTLIELGLIYVNKGDSRQALDFYKRVVAEFSGTAESRSALMGVKNIYVEMGDVDAYVRYVAGLKNVAQVNASERDSMTFAVAENRYSANDCDRAAPALQKYLNEFSPGAFAVDAHFYLADCHYRAGKLEEALASFSYVLGAPKSSYTEPALVGAARAALELGENSRAAGYYEQLEAAAGAKATVLEARVGKLRADYLSGNHAAVPADAAAVLATENLQPELRSEALFKRAKALEQLGAADKAMDDYALLAQNVKTAEGAEAQYKVVAYLFGKNELEKAEKAVLNFSKSGTSHRYWLAKSFIVLGDVYVKRNDAFQAKATYESIVDGYTVTDDGIVDEVAAKMQRLMASEKAKEDGAGQREVQLNIES